MDAPIRRDDSMLCGRLVAMPSTTPMQAALQNSVSSQGGTAIDFSKLAHATSIDFPAMPDTIELARSADYMVSTSITSPDGIHAYRSTKPLEIPISFKVHSMDSRYCKQGSLTLLQIAARLHSFILPISTFAKGQVSVAGNMEPEKAIDPKTGQPLPAGTGKGQPVTYQQQQNADGSPFLTARTVSSKTGYFTSPVTCWLHLLWTDNNQPGISCIGYVKDVKAVLGGPFLRGPSGSFNLPTWAEYSFTFVHHPGHGNGTPFTSTNFPDTIAESQNAYAGDVKDNLYNTRHLVFKSNYQGLSDS